MKGGEAPAGGARVTAPVLRVEGLVKHFVAKRSPFGRALATVKAVDGVSFHLDPGETLALVGESGCGKSTVGRLVTRLIEPTAGRIVLDGADVTALSEREFRPHRRRVQLVFQDPFASLNPRMTVGDTLAEPLMLHRLVPPARSISRYFRSNPGCPSWNTEYSSFTKQSPKA